MNTKIQACAQTPEMTSALGNVVAREPCAAREAMRPAYAWYVLGALTLLNVFSFTDRYILALMVAPMRRDLAISDTQMSLLMGFSFAIFYCVCGIPLGRLADSHSRRTVIALGCAAWSVMTAGCGLVKSFWQLLLLRVGVGVGEATLSPAAYSLITDYFPKRRLATAMSVYSMGIFVGTGIAFAFGGAVIAFINGNEDVSLPLIGLVHSWQAAFLLVGSPGILLALLMYTVKEPRRRNLRLSPLADAKSAPRHGVPLREVGQYFAQNKATLICLSVGYTLSALTSYTSWGPTLFIRNYGWSAAQAGIVYGLLTSVLGVLGVLAGGSFADYLAKRGFKDANMRLGLIVTLAWFPTGILFPLMPTGSWAVAMLIPTYFLVSAPWGAAAAALQEVVPDCMRGQAAAMYLLVLNLIGIGVGPTAVALVTDYVFHDDHALNYSLLIVGAASHVLAAVLLWKGLRYFRDSLHRVHQWNVANA